jgi:DNA-binding MarR family transcriptional regulator
LRTPAEAFDVAPITLISGIIFNGYVSAKDPATGKPTRPLLASTNTTREAFTEIVLDDPELDPVGAMPVEERIASTLESRTGTFIKRAEQALMAEKQRALKPFGLTVPQYSALHALSVTPLSGAQLARVCCVTPQSMASLLATLEGKKLIERTPSSVHMQVLVSRLIRRGHAVFRKADAAALAWRPGCPPRSSPKRTACCGNCCGGPSPHCLRSDGIPGASGHPRFARPGRRGGRQGIHGTTPGTG